MRLDEDAGHAQRHGRAGHHRRELALAARRSAHPARLLDRVRRVHHHRIARRRHDRQRAHVRDKRVVAEARPALGQKDVAVAGRCDLVGHVRHVPRREELALLDVDHGPRPPGRQQKVGLAAEEGGDLNDIRDVSCGGCLNRVVDVGQHRAADPVAHRLEHGEPLVHADAATTRQRGAVGLVVAGLEHEARPGARAGGGKRLCDRQRMVQRFQLARTRDQHQRQVVAEGHAARRDVQWRSGRCRVRRGGLARRHDDTCSRRIDAVSDSIRYDAAKIRKATIVFWNALG